jgi:hypothetical protein
LNKKYPFDPSIKHHLIIALGLAIWIFVFLFLTEPLDVHVFSDSEKLIYLPLYGLLGALCYLLFLPIQNFLFKKNDQNWFVKTEILFFLIFIFIGIVATRLFYLYVIVPGEPFPHDLSYQLKTVMLPVFATILPIIIFGRFAFGKYKNKKTEAQKIEIKGEGNYEGLRLLLNDVICIQSSDNYVEVFYLSGNDLKKSLIRNKLSVITDEFPEFLRTHRSYMINPYHFLQWETENSKLFVVLFHHIKAPVSKTYQTDVKAVLNSATE